MKVRLGNYIEEYSKKNKADEDIPVYSVTSTQGFCRDYFGKEVASKDKTTYKIVPQGCFAYNPSRINVGSVDWQRNEERVIVSPLYNVFSVSEELDQEYLYYYLKSDFALQRIRAVATGSVRDNLKLEMLKEFPILLPPKNDQKTIANNLDRVKRIIELRKSEIDKMNELIKARFVEMFGDVMHNDRKWECKQFSDITTSRLGKMLDAKHQTGTCKYPYLANFNVQWFRFELDNLNEMDFNEKDREEFCLEDGDLLVCEGGEIGRCAVWHNQVKKCFFQKALHRVRCNQDIILPDYLAWWFKYNCENGGFAAIEGAKATISHLTGVKMKMLDVTVPAIELQEQFADFIKQVDKSKVAVQKALEKTQLLFDSLMQQYFG
ncbi:restriction endonuclease subunit S [Blautia obeum]|jgi:type I restriction enzyme S subunit|uniref:restriction endonuclease subunit S n=1 Tax=Blautia obeum TaxID=40520 RepID=UPI001EDE2458|nr:restriction endonuclease subunit S [Blautia obeum]MCG4675759.1 restriction endonuclease subunit S [Blautia obeum]